MLNATYKPGETAGRGFGAWLQRIGLLSLLAFVCAVPVVLVAELAGERLDVWSYGVVAAFVSVAMSVTAGAASPAVFDGLDGAPPSWREVSGMARRSAFGLLTCGLLLGLLVSLPGWAPGLGELFGASMPSHRRGVMVFMLGLIGLVLSVFMAPAISLAPHVAVVERLGPGAAIRRSIALAKGHTFAIIATWLTALLGAAGLAAVILLPVRFLEDEVGTSLSTPTRLIGWLLAIVVVSGVVAGVSGAIYRDLRVVREGYGLRALIKIFE